MLLMVIEKGGNDIGLHYAEDQELADAIVVDLSLRYPGTKYTIKPTKMDRPCYDAGGMMCATNTYDEKGPVGFWPNQVDIFLAKANKHLGKIRDLPNGIRYAKMASFPGLLCVREATLKAAVADVTARRADIEAQANRDHSTWLAARSPTGTLYKTMEVRLPVPPIYINIKIPN